MLRRFARLLFNDRYDVLRKEGKLGGAAYEYLREHLGHYKALLDKYAVKQDDLERARRVGRVCGLEMTKKPQPRRPEPAADPQH